MKLEFRRLGLEDLEAYFANRLLALQNAPNAFLTTYEEEKARGNEHFKKTLSHVGNEKAIFGALQNQKVWGTIGLFREDRPKINHKAMIWGMYVHNDFRGQGAGAQLLDMAIAFARTEMKVELIQLSVESNNSAARKLYESRGFKCWGTEPKAMKSGAQWFDENHMSLIL